MPTDVRIEQRLAALEAAITEIRHRLEPSSPAPDWVERFRGSLQDEPAFAEVIAYGRELREADRPQRDGGS